MCIISIALLQVLNTNQGINRCTQTTHKYSLSIAYDHVKLLLEFLSTIRRLPQTENDKTDLSLISNIQIRR